MTLQKNPLHYREKTFGQLYAELQDRLGLVRQGRAANKAKSLLRSFLQEAHEFCFRSLEPATAKKRTTIQIEPGSCLYDYQNDIEIEDIHPAMILSVWLKNSEEDRRYMTQGITEIDRSRTEKAEPYRWDTLNGQIEIWPVPDKSYEMVVEYIAQPTRFSQDSDLCSVNSRLVFLYALAAAQTHYRRPEAQSTEKRFNALMLKEKAAQHQNKRYFVGGTSSTKEAVVGSDGNYHFYGRR